MTRGRGAGRAKEETQGMIYENVYFSFFPPAPPWTFPPPSPPLFGLRKLVLVRYISPPQSKPKHFPPPPFFSPHTFSFHPPLPSAQYKPHTGGFHFSHTFSFHPPPPPIPSLHNVFTPPNPPNWPPRKNPSKERKTLARGSTFSPHPPHPSRGVDFSVTLLAHFHAQ